MHHSLTVTLFSHRCRGERHDYWTCLQVAEVSVSCKTEVAERAALRSIMKLVCPAN